MGSSRQEVGQGEPQYTHFLCVSPDAPTNPVLYWLGNFDAQNTRFLLEGAMGPLRLDLGDTLYAPNLLEDHQVSSWACYCNYCCSFVFMLNSVIALVLFALWRC